MKKAGGATQHRAATPSSAMLLQHVRALREFSSEEVNLIGENKRNAQSLY